LRQTCCCAPCQHHGGRRPTFTNYAHIETRTAALFKILLTRLGL
jgi:hypothetical protein